MVKYSGLLLDIDNTIYDYNKSHEKALAAAIGFLTRKTSLSKESLIKYYDLARQQIHKQLHLTAASHNRMLYFQRLLELSGSKALKFSLDVYDEYWDSFLSNLTIRAGLYDFLDSVRNKKICFVTDLTAHIQHRKIRKLKLDKYVDFLVTSEEVGREKPHSSIFMVALRKLSLSPANVCMIGDDFQKDVKAAVKLGIKSFWLNLHKTDKKLNPMITTFKDFFELIEYLK